MRDWETDSYLRKWVKVDGLEKHGTTDANGVWVLSVKAPYRNTSCSYYWSCEYDNWWNPNAPQSISLEALVSDNGGPVAGHAGVAVYRAAYGLSVRPERHDVEPGEALPVTVLARGIDGRSMAGAEITLGLYQWNYTRQGYEAITESKLTSDVDGTVQTKLTIAKQGWYTLRAQAKDAAGRDVKVATWLWVYSGEYGYWDEPTNELKVTADRESYRPGDGELLIESPVTARRCSR
jgi:uncharacterized protein YfaS (alpha-2-macroglobulin family)